MAQGLLDDDVVRRRYHLPAGHGMRGCARRKREVLASIAYSACMVECAERMIDVTLSGEHLPGSPYTCYAHTRTAHPPLCATPGRPP